MIVDILSGEVVSPNRIFTKIEVEDMILRVLAESDQATLDKINELVEAWKQDTSVVDELERLGYWKSDAQL